MRYHLLLFMAAVVTHNLFVADPCPRELSDVFVKEETAEADLSGDVQDIDELEDYGREQLLCYLVEHYGSF